MDLSEGSDYEIEIITESGYKVRATGMKSAAITNIKTQLIGEKRFWITSQKDQGMWVNPAKVIHASYKRSNPH